MLAYGLTIFLSAFLLFQVQPLIGKYILPWFGGAPGVWTTCMLFFQLLLLAGYSYAHLTSRLLKPRRQVIVHVSLLIAAICLLPITPSDSWKPTVADNPVQRILLLLTVCLGLPYFILSATGPLLQQWFNRTNPGVSPYRLYALSNVGSLLALVSYPIVVEANLTRLSQAKYWAWGFVLFAVSCGYCGWKFGKTKVVASLTASDAARRDAKEAKPARTPITNIALWLLLPACASMLLLATTNKLCQDIAVIPFLWVLPLAIYLLSFIVSFDSPRWYGRGVFAPALVAALAAVSWALFLETDLALRWQVTIYLGALFICCMICHGELYRLRPAPEQLTGFYLMIAAGGAIGGVMVAVVAPLVFSNFYELHFGLLACGLLFLAVCLRDSTSSNHWVWRWLAGLFALSVVFGVDALLVWLDRRYPDVVAGRLTLMRSAWWAALVLVLLLWILRKQYKMFQHWRHLTCFWLSLGWIALALSLWFQAWDFAEKVVSQSRNFYGTLRICEYRKDEPESHYFLLEHGRITHGLQFVDPFNARLATTYYGGSNGLALAMNALPSDPRRIGVVGLGTGTTTAYGRPGDTFHIYEINPEVVRLATSRFTYLSNCPAKVEIALGDARLSLEHEPPQHFDLLALDAFSSDAIPVHLLTKEAFEIYARHVKTNGVIAVHISNRYLNLEPVVRRLGRQFGYHTAVINFEEDDDDEEEAEWWIYSSTWVLLTHNEALFNRPAIQSALSKEKTNTTSFPLWTDDFASLFQIFE